MIQNPGSIISSSNTSTKFQLAAYKYYDTGTALKKGSVIGLTKMTSFAFPDCEEIVLTIAGNVCVNNTSTINDDGQSYDVGLLCQNGNGVDLFKGYRYSKYVSGDTGSFDRFSECNWPSCLSFYELHMWRVDDAILSTPYINGYWRTYERAEGLQNSSRQSYTSYSPLSILSGISSKISISSGFRIFIENYPVYILQGTEISLLFR